MEFVGNEENIFFEKGGLEQNLEFHLVIHFHIFLCIDILLKTRSTHGQNHFQY